ncbi:cytochrome b-c1 complex subunit 10 [Pogona vitticeps]
MARKQNAPRGRPEEEQVSPSENQTTSGQSAPARPGGGTQSSLKRGEGRHLPRLRRREGDFGLSMKLMKFMGPRYFQLFRHWSPTVATWSSMTAVAVVWMTDWKLVLQYVPWIGGKFKTDN